MLGFADFPRPIDLPYPLIRRFRIARERILVLDGAIGTSLHCYQPTDREWGHSPSGQSLMNLSDAIVSIRTPSAARAG